MSHTNKRNATDGFSPNTIDERLKNMRKYGASWRKIEQRKVVMTVLSQNWTHTSGVTESVKHICPWGMRATVSKYYLRKVCKNFQSVPTKLKESLPEYFTKDGYDPNEWSLSVSNSGAMDGQSYYHLYCQHCKEVLIPKVLKEVEARSSVKTIDELIANWDVLKLKDAYLDYIGTFLPWDPEVNAAPNARKYIRDQSDHPKTSHHYTVSNVTKKRHLTQSKVASSQPPKKTMTLEPAKPVDIKQYAIIGKGTKKQTCMKLDNYLGIQQLLGSCSTPMQKLGKCFCLKMVHTGTNKMQSQESIIENYLSGYEGMETYYTVASDIVRSTHPSVTLPRPVTVQLNDHNIIKAQRAILDVYRYDNPISVYKKFERAPFYSLMHDGITKYCTEYNGVFLRAIDENNDPFVVPYCLSKMNGGVTGHDTALEIICNVTSIMSSLSPSMTTAYTSVRKHFDENNPGEIPPNPPTYFKLGSLRLVDEECKEIHIDVGTKFPIGNCGDGVAVNIKGARLLRVLFGFESPDFRCAAHAASGTIKRLATSKTMCVTEVSAFYDCLRVIVCHFETSVKNKELLDDCMEILELTPLNLISWCQTRMLHFLKACSIFNAMLPAVYDVMYTRGIRVDDRDTLFSPTNIYILVFIAELDPVFSGKFLRKSDKGDLLVSTVYSSAVKFASEMEEFNSPISDKFIEDLKLDSNGNLIATTKIDQNTHTMTLNHPHKRTRGVSEEDRLQKVKDSLVELKCKILQNIVSNVKDQCDDETFFFSWSGLDLEANLTTEIRKERLKDIVTLYCTDKDHTVQKYTDKKETVTEPDMWEGYNVTLHYSKAIDCTESDMMKELESLFKVVGGLWLQEINAAKADNRPRNQLAVWKRFLSAHALDLPNASQLVQIMISTAPNTSPLERGYTHLQMVASKRRSRLLPENLETLFLLATLKVPLKKPMEYEAECLRLA